MLESAAGSQLTPMMRWIYEGTAGLLASGISLGYCLASRRKDVRSIAVSYISPQPTVGTGLSSYTRSLVEAMASDPARPIIHFMTNVENEQIFAEFANHPNMSWVQLPARGYLPYKLYEPLIHCLACAKAAFRGCTAYVSCTAAAAPLPLARQYFVLHDLYDIELRFRPLRTVLYSHVMWRIMALVSRGIVCVSQATYQEAQPVLGFARRKMHVILEASKYSSCSPASPLTHRQFAFVANLQPNKNVECLLATLGLAEKAGEDLTVRWVGRDDGRLARWVRQHGMPKGLVTLGSVSEEQLQTVYRESWALIVPSFKEGFCLPVLEAHSFGVPVIAADIPILREVAGEGALFFDPNRPDQLLEKLSLIASSPDLRQELSLKSLINVRRFSWEKSARRLLDLVEIPAQVGGT